MNMQLNFDLSENYVETFCLNEMYLDCYDGRHRIFILSWLDQSQCLIVSPIFY